MMADVQASNYQSWAVTKTGNLAFTNFLKNLVSFKTLRPGYRHSILIKNHPYTEWLYFKRKEKKGVKIKPNKQINT